MLNWVRTKVQLTKKINPMSEKKLLLIALLLGKALGEKPMNSPRGEFIANRLLLLLLLRWLLLRVPLHSFLHALLVLRLELFQLRLLIGC